MGIGITGISKAKLVPCSGGYVEGEYDVCLEEHYTVERALPGARQGEARLLRRRARRWNIRLGLH